MTELRTPTTKPAEAGPTGTAPTTSPAANDRAASPEPLPRPVASDPLEQRALAAGLHPGLSRALLMRLSPADYRNADMAVRIALADTPDSEALVWPTQRKPELALFKIYFVPGAAPACRRYVVIVSKDGWQTTASPMERCGAANPRARQR